MLPLHAPTTGLIGFEAWQKFLNLFFAEGDHLHLKFSHNQFNYADVKLTGNFPLHTTQLKYKNEPTSRYTTGTEQDAFKYLDQKAKEHDGGVFFIPGKPTDFPLKDFCFESDLLSAEFDEGTAEEQWQWIRKVAEISGLAYTTILSSGGKSFHEHWKLDRKIPIAERTNLQRLIAIALGSDPAVTNPHQPMRIPGFFRKEKANYQVLLHADHTAIYSVDQVVEGLKKLFAYKGLKFPDQPLTDYQFKVYKRIRKNFTVEKWEEILANPEKPEPTRIYKSRLDSEENQTSKQKSSPQTFRTIYNNSDNFWEIYNNEVVHRLDAWEIFNSWPGHNYRDRGNGEFDGDCFLHASSSKTSFAIDVNKKVWHSRAGYGGGGFIEYIHALRSGNITPSGKERYEIACELFQKAGVEIPTHQRKTKTISRHEWEALKARKSTKAEEIISNDFDFDNHQQPEDDSPELEGTISREDWKKLQQQRAKELWEKKKAERKQAEKNQKEYEQVHNLPGFFKRQIARIKRIFSNARERENQKNILFSEPDIWVEQTLKRLDYITEAIRKNWKVIFVSCDAGTGKSHEVIGFQTAKFYQDNGIPCTGVLNVSRSGRDSATPTIEANFHPVTARAKEWAIDPIRKTPLGNPILVHPTKENPATIAGNCLYADYIQTLKAKGYDVEGRRACALLGCKFFSYDPAEDTCAQGFGAGYGFRHLRKQDLTHQNLRMHWSSIPLEPDFLKGKIINIDEIGSIISGVHVLELSLDDIAKTQASLMTFYPDQNEVLGGWLSEIHRFMMEENLPYHGADIQTIRKAIQIPEDQQEAILKACEIYDNDLYKEINKKTVETVQKCWLTRFFTVFLNKERGAVRIGKRQLFDDEGRSTKTYIYCDITTLDERIKLIFDHALAVICLDWTLSKQALANLIGIDAAEILQIQQERPSYNNLTIVQLTGLENCGGGNPSKDMQGRMEAIAKKFWETHGHDKSVLGRKGFNQKWWVDNRLQNRDAGKEARLSFGTPYQNLGALQDRFITLKGKYYPLGAVNGAKDTDPELQAEINRGVQAEYGQDAARLRCHRYLDKQFIQYYVTDFPLDFLQDAMPGVNLVKLDAFEFTPMAGDAGQRTLWAIEQKIKRLTQQGRDIASITQKEIAASVGRSVIRLKQIAQTFGGWKKFKQGIVALISTNSATIPSAELDLSTEDKRFIDSWLPGIVAELRQGNTSALADIGLFFKTEGLATFKKFVSYLDPDTRADILLSLWQEINPENLEEILEATT